MDDEFLTEAVQNDRYLKAIRLVEEFETQAEQELRRIVNEIVKDNSEHFPRDAEGGWWKDDSPDSPLGFLRIDYPMSRVDPEEGGDQLNFSVFLFWDDPGDYGRTDSEGALCGLGYRIRNCSADDHADVKLETEDSDTPLLAGHPPYDNSPGIFYIPVESADDVRMAEEEIKTHFARYAREYGVEGHDE